MHPSFSEYHEHGDTVPTSSGINGTSCQRHAFVLFSSLRGVSSSILSSSSKVIAIISLTLSRKQRFLSLTKISLSLFVLVVSRLLLLFQNLFFNNKPRATTELKILYKEICASLLRSYSLSLSDCFNARACKACSLLSLFFCF